MLNTDFSNAENKSMNTFTRSVDFLQRAMSVNSLRFQVTANNVANAGVPNYKRQEVNFESELRRALESEKNPSPLNLATSDSLTSGGISQSFSNLNA